MSHFKQRIALFKNRSFSCYVLSCSLAMFGNGLTYVAMTWALLKSQHQVEAVAILMACFWLPSIVLGPLAGVIVDKYNRKTILLACNFGRALLLIAFFLIFNHNAPPAYAIYSLSALTGAVLSLYIPAAMTLVREIVDKKVLLYANATVDMAYELGAVAGMGASGLIIHLSSVQHTFLINAICYLAACLSLLFVNTHSAHQQPDKKHEAFFKELSLGLNYLRSQPALKLIYCIQMLLFVSYMTAPILLAPYAKTILHTNAGEFGYIEAAMSVGAVLGGVFSPYLCEKIGFSKVMFAEILIGGFSFYFFSHNLYLPSAILWYFFIGICFSAWPLLITEAQERTEFSFQGRVQALFNAVSGVLILIFYSLLAVVGDSFSIQKLYWLEVVMMLASIGMLLNYARQHRASE